MNITNVVLAPHEQRVVEEKDELDKKIAKLDSFGRGDIFAELSPNEQSLLGKQLSIMEEYSEILGKRIDIFKEKSK